VRIVLPLHTQLYVAYFNHLCNTTTYPTDQFHRVVLIIVKVPLDVDRIVPRAVSGVGYPQLLRLPTAPQELSGYPLVRPANFPTTELKLELEVYQFDSSWEIDTQSAGLASQYQFLSNVWKWRAFEEAKSRMGTFFGSC
jgi:hypothetical protein